MKGIIKFLSFIFVVVMVFQIIAPTASASETDPNYMHTERQAQIEQLMEMRQNLVWSDDVDLFQLNEIDLQLHDLGVSFLTDEDVSTQFPDAKLAVENTNPISTNEIISDELVEPTYDIGVHEGSDNCWTTYTLTDYCRDDCYMDIQMVTAVPNNEDSPLWIESNSTYDYFEDEVYPVLDNVLSVAVSSAVGRIIDDDGISTIFDLFCASISGLAQDDELSINEIVYLWEGRTFVTFAYISFSGMDDGRQELITISNKCHMVVSISMDVEKYEETETGALLPVPARVSSDYEFVATAFNYANPDRAAFIFVKNHNYPEDDVISYLNVSPLEGQSYIINIPTPRSPIYCDIS